jgi:cold shock CspA family protein
MTTDNRESQVGILHKWYSDRGFGFLKTAVKDWQGRYVPLSDRRRADTFLHVQQARLSGIDVSEGDILQFSVGVDRKGKPCAINLVKVDVEQTNE